MSEELFWSNVDRTDNNTECWFWKLSCDRRGYGQVKYQKKMKRSHRVAFEWFYKRPINDGMFLLHSCDERKCCNPNHLREGTPQDNMDDKVLRNRQSRGEACYNSKLIEAQVIEIRNKYAKGTYTQKELCNEYNISRSAISSIIRRSVWAYIPA